MLTLAATANAGSLYTALNKTVDTLEPRGTAPESPQKHQPLHLLGEDRGSNKYFREAAILSRKQRLVFSLTHHGCLSNGAKAVDENVAAHIHGRTCQSREIHPLERHHRLGPTPGADLREGSPCWSRLLLAPTPLPNTLDSQLPFTIPTPGSLIRR